MNSLIGSSSESLVFVRDGSKLLKSLFKKEQMSEERHWRFALGQNCQKHTKIQIFPANCSSFVTSKVSESLTVALLQRATLANHSRSLFKMSNFERKSEGRKSELQKCEEQKRRERKSEEWKSKFPTLIHSKHNVCILYMQIWVWNCEKKFL